jgi:hypothetical protein
MYLLQVFLVLYLHFEAFDAIITALVRCFLNSVPVHPLHNFQPTSAFKVSLDFRPVVAL